MGWFLWFGIKEAMDILNERYARGELSREEWGRMKVELATPA